MTDADIRAGHIRAGIISTNRTPVFAKVFETPGRGSGYANPLSADELARRGFHDAATAKRSRVHPEIIGYNSLYRTY